MRNENNTIMNNIITILKSTTFDQLALYVGTGGPNNHFINNRLTIAGTNTIGITNFGSGVGNRWENITIDSQGSAAIYAGGTNETFNNITSTQYSGGTYNLVVSGTGNVFTNIFLNSTSLTYGSVRINAPNTTIQNITIYSYNTNGIRVDSTGNTIDCKGASIIGDNTNYKFGFLPTKDNNILKNCIISNFSKSIFLDGLSGVIIDNVTAISNNEFGIAFHISNSSNITVSNSKASITAPNSGYSQAALRIDEGSHNNQIIDSTFSSTNGLSDSVRVNQTWGNNFTNVQTYCQPQIEGIVGSSFSLYYSNYTRLENVTGVGGYGIIGILIAHSSYNSINNSLGIANDTEYLCKWEVGSLTNNMGIAIFSNSHFNNLTNSIGVSQSEDGLAILNSSNNLIVNVTATTWGMTGIILTVSASNNSIINSTGIALGNPSCATGFALSIADDSNNNLVSGSIFHQGNVTDGNGLGRGAFAVSDAGALGDRRPSTNNTLINNIIYLENGNAMTVSGNSSTGNIFRNNTIISTGIATSIWVETAGNIFCLNNLSSSTTAYINDTNGTNQYNCTYEGKNQGNIYPNVINGSVSITGNIISSISNLYVGSVGTGFPYNNVNSLNKVIGMIDYAPLTNLLTPVIEEPTTPSSSGGGSLSTTYTQTQLQKGINGHYPKNYVINFNGDFVKVNNISEDKVELNVSNNIIEIVFDEIVKIDSDDGGFYDLEISLGEKNSIYAYLSIKSIYEEMPAVSEEAVVEDSVGEVVVDEVIGFFSKIWNWFRGLFRR